MTDERIRELADNLAEDLNGEVRDLWYRAEEEARAAEEISKVIRTAVEEAVAAEQASILLLCAEIAAEAEHDGNHTTARIAREVAQAIARRSADRSADENPKTKKAG